MKKNDSIFKKTMLYCGLDQKEYEDITHLIANRNEITLRITTLLVTIFAAVFLIFNFYTRSGLYLPYIFLAAMGFLVLFLLKFKSKKDGFRLFLCYLMLLAVFAYAMILSFEGNNSLIPATSIIGFFAVLPLTIDDRPIRMYIVLLTCASTYIALSFFMKPSSAFKLDLVNTLTFTFIGVVLYYVICMRNVNEIYQSTRISKLQDNIITSLATIIEERDSSTGGHIMRTDLYIARLSKEMKENEYYSNIPDSFYDNVYRAAPMHDIGKIKISDVILNKPGKLTEEEYEIMKKHSEYGADIIKKTMWKAEEESYFKTAYNMTLYHHERYDGTGYPEGLAGDAIPLEARMMAIADVYDALISERVYKKAFSKDEAKRILKEGRGTQFDPVLLDMFIKALEKYADKPL